MSADRLRRSPVRKIDFNELLETADGQNPFEVLMSDIGVVYVTAVTRGGCSYCDLQKPGFLRLARRIGHDFPGQSEFLNIHVPYGEDNKQTTQLAKQELGVLFYPTNMIHVRSQDRLTTVFVAVSPTMVELSRHIRGESLQLAQSYRKKAA